MKYPPYIVTAKSPVQKNYSDKQWKLPSLLNRQGRQIGVD